MKTSIACPNAILDAASGSTGAESQPAMQAVAGTEISSQTNTSPLRVVHKCLKSNCVRWQQNRCGAMHKMLKALEEKEATNQPVNGGNMG